MSGLQIVYLTLYAAGMAVGQLLFKMTALKLSLADAQSFSEISVRILKIALDPVFVSAIVLYMGLSVFWVWILSFIPITRAYPFGALAFVFTIMIGVVVFRENVTRTDVAGMILILAGVGFIARA